MEKSRTTRKNHIGQYTTTVILTDTAGRIYGHGMTRQAAEDAATDKIAIYYGNQAWRVSPKASRS